MTASQEDFHSFHEEFPDGPSRRSSPDHGFVFVGSDNHSADASQQQELYNPTEGMSRSSSQLQNASTEGGADSGQVTPAWMDRAMEQTRKLLDMDHTPSASDMLAAPGSQASLVGENAHLRARLMEVSAQHQWALEAVVSGKDKDKDSITAALRDMTDQRDALELELRHNEKEFVRLVSEAMEEKLAQSFERFAGARSMMPPGPDGATELTPLPFDRLMEVLKGKTAQHGVVPRTSVELDTNGLPAHVSLDWAVPEQVLEGGEVATPAPVPTPAPAPRPAASQRKRRGIGWPKPRPGAAINKVRGAVTHVSNPVVRGVRSVPKGIRGVGGIPRKTAQGPVGQTVRRTVMKVKPAVHAVASSVSYACQGVSHAVVGTCASFGGLIGEQLSKMGSLFMRFVSWLRQPDTIERLETYLGLAIVLLTSYVSLRLLRVQPPRPPKRFGHRSHKKLQSNSLSPEPITLSAPHSKRSSDTSTAPDAPTEPVQPLGHDSSGSTQWEAILHPISQAMPSLPPLPSLPEITIDEVDDGAVIHIDGHSITLPRFMRATCHVSPASEQES